MVDCGSEGSLERQQENQMTTEKERHLGKEGAKILWQPGLLFGYLCLCAQIADQGLVFPAKGDCGHVVELEREELLPEK